MLSKLIKSAGSALLLLGFATPIVLAGPSTGSIHGTAIATSSSGSGAIVVKGAPCAIPVPGEPSEITTESHSVITPSGNIALTCHAKGAPRGATFSGRLDEVCKTPAGVTSGHLVATRSGRINLSCHVHPDAGTSTEAAPALHGNSANHRWQHGAVAGTGPAAVGRKIGHRSQ